MRARDDAGPVERERSFRIGKQRDHGVVRYVPGNGVLRQPVRLGLREIALDAADDHA